MAFRSLAILSALVSAVLAQSNSLIPASISSKCTAYLSALNTDTQIQSCLTSITTALEAFSPTGNLASCSSSTVDTALGSLCTSSSFNACPQSVLTAHLSEFYANCQAELTSSPNPQVKLLYDALYVLLPFQQAMCSKDDNGDYCATKLSNSSSSNPNTGSSLYVRSLSRRDSNSTTPVFVPNITTFQNDNIVFLLLQPSLTSSQLCTACTRNVLAPYIDFESSVLHASGLSQSMLLVGQTSIYNNVTSKCGSSFLTGAVAAAGGLSQGVVGAASRIGVQELSTAMGAILGVAGFVAASF